MTKKTIQLILILCSVMAVQSMAQSISASVARNYQNADSALSDVLKNWFKPIENPDLNFLKKQQAAPTPMPVIKDLEHVILHYNKETYCGHPRMINFKYFPP